MSTNNDVSQCMPDNLLF